MVSSTVIAVVVLTFLKYSSKAVFSLVFQVLALIKCSMYMSKIFDGALNMSYTVLCCSDHVMFYDYQCSPSTFCE